MNHDNYQFLCETMEGLGFGNFFHGALKTELTLDNKDEFSFKGVITEGKDNLTIEPTFKRSEDPQYADRFFLNRVKGTLKMENGEKISAEFPTFKKSGYKVDQMYRMLKLNRPVYKKYRGEKVGRWTKIDSANLDENGNARIRNYPDDVTNFRLDKEVDKLPLKFANAQDREDFIIDLQNGLAPTGTIRKDGRNEAITVEVGKQVGGLLVLNSKGEKIMETSVHQLKMSSDEKVSMETSQNNTKEKLPEATKQLMEKINEAEVNQGQNNKHSKRQAS